MTMLTIHWPKFVAAIYKCHIEFVDYQIIPVLSFGFQVFIKYVALSSYYQVFTLALQLTASHIKWVPIAISAAHNTKRQIWQIDNANWHKERPL
jgi:hypothetical protein